MPPAGSSPGRAATCTMTPEHCCMCCATAWLSHSAGPWLTSDAGLSSCTERVLGAERADGVHQHRRRPNFGGDPVDELGQRGLWCWPAHGGYRWGGQAVPARSGRPPPQSGRERPGRSSSRGQAHPPAPATIATCALMPSPDLASRGLRPGRRAAERSSPDRMICAVDSAHAGLIPRGMGRRR